MRNDYKRKLIQHIRYHRKQGLTIGKSEDIMHEKKVKIVEKIKWCEYS